MDSNDLEKFIRGNDIKAEIIHLPAATPTVAAAAEAAGVEPAQIIKSVLFLSDGSPVLVISNGLVRIDRKRLAEELRISRRRVKIADGEQVKAITGYPVGAVPPIGHINPIPALLDEGVMAESLIYGGGGEINALLKMTPSELRRVVNGRIVNIADREDAD